MGNRYSLWPVTNVNLNPTEMDPGKRIHLVAHSIGALVVREYLARGKPERLGRVVLLAAPNQGSPIAEPLMKNMVAPHGGPMLSSWTWPGG